MPLHITLTYSCDHQELPEEQQQVRDFIEHHDPEGTRRGNKSRSNTPEGLLCREQVRQKCVRLALETQNVPTNLTTFLMSSMKAFLAETQKFFP